MDKLVNLLADLILLAIIAAFITSVFMVYDAIGTRGDRIAYSHYKSYVQPIEFEFNRG